MPARLYLSPHLDDAVLSCGGLIHRQAQRGERVIVLTICAGQAPSGPLSPFAEELHARWGLSAAEAVLARREEDRRAVQVLGAEAVHLDVPDCIYRRHPGSGQPLYPTGAAIMGALSPHDEALVQRLAEDLPAHAGPGVEVYAPLGIGGHVDHQLARRAAESSGLRLTFVEDYPYAGQAQDDAEWAGLRAGLAPAAEPLDEGDLDAQCRAILAYESQISTFWPDEAALRAAVSGFFGRRGRPAVRLWR